MERVREIIAKIASHNRGISVRQVTNNMQLTEDENVLIVASVSFEMCDDYDVLVVNHHHGNTVAELMASIKKGLARV